jgi:drug/metabolite transporter (DMT)-like permease
LRGGTDGGQPQNVQGGLQGVTAATTSEVEASEAAKRREHVPLGILYMVGATLVFSVSSACSKSLVKTYPFGEVLFTRSLVSLVTLALFILPATGLAVFRTTRLRHHVLRSFSQFCSQSCLIIAFSMMSLAGAIAINFSSPLFATLASILLFKEKVGLARWSGLLVGFLGVLIVTNPGAGAFQVGALFALTNAILYGTVTAAVRGMTATESAATLTLYQLLLISGFFALIAPFGFIMPTWEDWGLTVFNGVMNAIGQYWWTRSLHLGPASAVSPFFYLSLVWAVALGYLVWGDLPTASLLIGSAIVVGSGLFLLWREARKVPREDLSRP